MPLFQLVRNVTTPAARAPAATNIRGERPMTKISIPRSMRPTITKNTAGLSMIPSILSSLPDLPGTRRACGRRRRGSAGGFENRHRLGQPSARVGVISHDDEGIVLPGELAVLLESCLGDFELDRLRAALLLDLLANQPNRFGLALRDIDRRLLFAFRAQDGCLTLAIGAIDLRLFDAFRFENRGAFVALGLHLPLHGF